MTTTMQAAQKVNLVESGKWSSVVFLSRAPGKCA